MATDLSCVLNFGVFIDYAEERQMELEALESIYPDEYEGTTDSVYSTNANLLLLCIALGEGEFRITIYPDEEDDEVQCR